MKWKWTGQIFSFFIVPSRSYVYWKKCPNLKIYIYSYIYTHVDKHGKKRIKAASRIFNLFSWSAAKHLCQDQGESESAGPQTRSHHCNVSISVFSPTSYWQEWILGEFMGRRKNTREPLVLRISVSFPSSLWNVLNANWCVKWNFWFLTSDRFVEEALYFL